jgi:hypothetical protein
LHNEELRELYSSANIIWLIKLRRVRWVERVMRMGEKCIRDFGGETWGKETTWET